MGTDATRVASYNPWVALYWLTTGRTLGGTARSTAKSNRLEREEALRLWTHGSAWFSNEQDAKGAPGRRPVRRLRAAVGGLLQCRR